MLAEAHQEKFLTHEVSHARIDVMKNRGLGIEPLERIVDWAKKEESVRALILTGSHARAHGADELSDFDVEIYARDHDRYVKSDKWIAQIADVIFYIPLTRDDIGYPTRLVIFEGGTKVDFSLLPVSVLNELAGKRLSDLHERGYKVLVDKDRLALGFPKPRLKPRASKKPHQREFQSLVEEFWFEAYHVAKYLKREELWAVKFRDWTTKELLLKMIEWHEKALHGWDYDTQHLGLGMKRWLEPATWKQLHTSFAHFDAKDSQRALEATTKLFRKVARETAKRMALKYPVETDRKISRHIAAILR